MKYIALLRGVNVGGKSKISMAELKKAFVQNGFEDVSSYVNSGNIIFSSDIAEESLKGKCEALIKDGFGVDIPVALLSANAIISAKECQHIY